MTLTTMRITYVHRGCGFDMQSAYLATAAKKPVNVSLNGDLLRLARELGLNVSALAEKALDEAVRAALGAAWARENAGAIAAYNERVEERGVFSDGMRAF